MILIVARIVDESVKIISDTKNSDLLLRFYIFNYKGNIPIKWKYSIN